MISSMISSMISPMIRPMIGDDTGGGATTRCFIELDPVLNSYYLLLTPEVFTGYLQITYVTTTTATEMDFADGFGITVGGIYKAPASVTDIELNGIGVGLGAAAILDGKENTIKFIGAVSETITVFGQSGSATNYFNGILSNPNINGVTNFKLDEPTGNTELSVEGNNTLTYVNIPEAQREEFTLSDDGWIGSFEYWNYIPFSYGGTAFVDNGDGSFTTTGGSTDSGIRAGIENTVTFGETYLSSVDFTDGEFTSALVARVGNKSESLVGVGAPIGIYTVNIVAATSNKDMRFMGSSTITSTFKDLSVKRLIEIA